MYSTPLDKNWPFRTCLKCRIQGNKSNHCIDVYCSAQSLISVFPAFSKHPRGSCVPHFKGFHFEMILLTEDTLFHFLVDVSKCILTEKSVVQHCDRPSNVIFGTS